MTLEQACRLARCVVLATMLGPGAVIAAQLDQDWTVTINGQTVVPNADGSFRISNVSAADLFGPGGPGTPPDFVSDDAVRVLGISNAGGMTRYAFSEPFRLVSGESFRIGDLTFTDIPPPVPQSLTITFDSKTLTEVGEETQARVFATLGDGSVMDVTQRKAWTSYRTSNPNIASITEDGLVTATGAGIASITATNDGATAVGRLFVVPGDPLTTVEGVVTWEDGSPALDAVVSVVGFTPRDSTGTGGEFSIPGLPTSFGPLAVVARKNQNDSLYVGRVTIDPVPGGVTYAGTIVLSASAGILVIGDGSTENSITPILEAEGYDVTLFPGIFDYNFDGSYDLSEFSTVVLADGASGWEVGMPTGGQLALKAFVGAGGGIVIMEWVAYEFLYGRYQAMPELIPLRRNGVGSCDGQTYVVQEAHPITSGLPASFTVPPSGSNTGSAVSGAVLISSTTTTIGDVVVIDQYGEGRIVQLANAGNYNEAGCSGGGPFTQGEASINFIRLFVQSVDWAAYGGGAMPEEVVRTNDDAGAEILGVLHPASSPASQFGGTIPFDSVLRPARPNPFVGETTIAFGLGVPERFDVAVYDVTGRLVATLTEGWKPAGWHMTSWRGTDHSGNPVASGTYFVQLRVGSHTERRTITLLR